MKKTLLAAALLTGYAGAAMAQNSVTIYGIIDAGLRYQSITTPGDLPNASSFAMASGQQSQSRLGFRGTESLGDGLSATFQLEGSLDVTGGSTSVTFNRISTIGLTSTSFGTILLGRDASPTNKVFGLVDPFFGSFSTASTAGNAFGQASGRYNSMISYQSPSVGGFVGRVAYSFSTGGNNATFNEATNALVVDTGSNLYRTNENVRTVSASGAYTNGPLALIAAYDQIFARSNNPVSPPSLKAYLLGGGYDFKVARVTAAYGRQIDGIMNPGQALAPFAEAAGEGLGTGNIFIPGATSNSYMVTGSVPVGDAGRVLLGWGMQQPGGTLKGDGSGNMNVGSVAYLYNLSARTNIYAFYSYANNYQMISGMKVNTVGIGARHLF